MATLPITPYYYRNKEAIEKCGAHLLQVYAQQPEDAVREVDLLIDLYSFGKMNRIVRSNIEQTICEFFVNLPNPALYLTHILRFASIRSGLNEEYLYEGHFSHLITHVRLPVAEKLSIVRVVLPPSGDYEKEMWQKSAWDLYGSLDSFKNLFHQPGWPEGIYSSLAKLLEAHPGDVIPELARWMDDNTAVGGNSLFEIAGNFLYNYRRDYGQEIVQALVNLLLDIGYLWQWSHVHDLLDNLCGADPSQFEPVITRLNELEPHCFENDSVLHTLLLSYLSHKKRDVPENIHSVIRDVWDRGFVKNKSASLIPYIPGLEKESFEFISDQIRQRRNFFPLHTLQGHLRNRFDNCMDFFEHIVAMCNYYSRDYLNQLLLLLKQFQGTDQQHARIADLFSEYLDKSGFNKQHYALMLEFQMRRTHPQGRTAHEKFEDLSLYVLQHWDRKELSCVTFYIGTLFQHRETTLIPVRVKFIERLIALNDKGVQKNILDAIVRNHKTVVGAFGINILKILSALTLGLGVEAVKGRLAHTSFSTQSQYILDQLGSHHPDVKLPDEFLSILQAYAQNPK